MRLTVFGASGGVGRQVLEQALAAGHEVTAVVRDPDKVADYPVRVVVADLMHTDLETLVDAVRGADAVLSAVGPRSNALAGVASHGTKAIIQAMREARAHRLIVLSAAPVRTTASPDRPHPPEPHAGDGFFVRDGWFVRNIVTPLVRRGLRPRLNDLALMEDALWNSGLDWTAVRPAQLTYEPLTGTYRTEVGDNIPAGRPISRADVAHFMLQEVNQPDTIRHAIGLAA